MLAGGASRIFRYPLAGSARSKKLRHVRPARLAHRRAARRADGQGAGRVRESLNVPWRHYDGVGLA